MSNKIVFTIEGMHCASCALAIDEELEEVAGVKRSKTSYARQRAEVEFNEQAVSVTELVAAINRAGYKAVAAPNR